MYILGRLEITRIAQIFETYRPERSINLESIGDIHIISTRNPETFLRAPQANTEKNKCSDDNRNII